MKKKVAFYTLGCKLNYAETEAIARRFEEALFSRVEFSHSADYYVINTCSVTEVANKKSRNIIRKALKKNTHAKVIVVGCYAQLKPQEIISIAGVSLVLGAHDKFNIIEKLQELEEGKLQSTVSSCEISNVSNFESSYSLNERTRSFLKVQDGCNYNCSYCTIPQARGTSRNATIASIVQQAHEIAQSGIQEIVLTGINIGDFGRTTGEQFLDLLKALDKVEPIKRYRISSIEPNLLTSDIIDFVAQSRAFMPHFHIPLQSGCDEVLRLMRRRYTTDFFAQKIREIKQKIPYAGIGIDVIVGTNGETDEYFQNTYSFLKSLPISYLHVFTYSERENTDALAITPRIPEHERQQRNLILHELSEELSAQFLQQNAGQIRPVLFEMKQKNGVFVGYSDNYIRVQSTASGIEKNMIVYSPITAP
ncbi:MAG: tRNA (N(6)-L-threonylcarbamoyladenosine(37)-C(2))-methylthiotransferase MtaB [Bacteroidetes bacterium]|nr:tRNA (N(6)-L-threonylcarbamoyladenosine(37)-C(2))-methylthiotransferase MtaB [Bacteroidota bacterium]